MTEIKDWKGNIVKEGDEVCFIKIRDREYIMPSGFLYNGKFYTTEMSNKPESEIWIVKGFYKTHFLNGNLAITKTKDSYTITNYLSTELAFMDTGCWQLGIKGISDTP